jgi:hypothetical protein
MGSQPNSGRFPANPGDSSVGGGPAAAVRAALPPGRARLHRPTPASGGTTRRPARGCRWCRPNLAGESPGRTIRSKLSACGRAASTLWLSRFTVLLAPGHAERGMSMFKSSPC